MLRKTRAYLDRQFVVTATCYTAEEFAISRRTLLGVLVAATATFTEHPAAAKTAVSNAGDWSSPGLAAPVDELAPKFFKTASGVKIQEIALGSGPEAGAGDQVLFDYVLRRSNGYFIYGTVEGVSFQPKDVPVGPVSEKIGDGNLIAGLEEVLVGMRPGAKRRALIPPEVGYVNQNLGPQPPTFATKRQLDVHRTEPLLFEIQLLRVNQSK